VKPNEQILKVWGELACFTRPEMKVERFSYPVITPSAARGIYDAIYCKPNKDFSRCEFRWQITRVEILSYPRYIALRRNEVKDKAPPEQTIWSWMRGEKEPMPIWADGTAEVLGTDQKGRTQRQTMALKNVSYYLYAEMRPWKGFENCLPALEAQFRRRAAHGKCLYQPYLGCREFPAYFELVENGSPKEAPVELNMDIGWMLYDVFDLSQPGQDDSAPSISLFHAEVKNGVLIVPDYESTEVRKGLEVR
jgi:CRISPR-associated protein Cas5d